MDLSAQVVTMELRRGLVHLDGRAATLEGDERAPGGDQLRRHAHELAHVGHGAGSDHVGLALAAQLLGARLVDRHVVEAQVLHNVHQPLDAARHGLGQVHVELGATGGDHDARQARSGADVEDLTAILAGHKVQEGGGVDDVARPNALHVARAEEAANLAFLLEHAREFGDLGKGRSEEVADGLRGLFWDEGVADLATPSRPVRVLTHRRCPRGG